MRRKTLRIVLSTLAILIGILLLLACGIGYSVYAWLQVSPIEVASDANEAERLAAVDRWLDELFEKHKFNGGIMFVRDGQVLLSKTCGFTDHTATQRLDDHSAFQLASVSKQFTAAGILRLAEMGLLNLDDPVAKHLDGFISDKVTIRHLLNQTSGIPDVYMDLAEQHRKELGKVLTTSDVVELVKQYGELERQPGDAMEYSNTNYVLLAGIVESASGMSFEHFMHKELFKPLGMNDTRVWNLLSAKRSSNQASDFDQVDDDRTPVETTWIDGVAGDGAIFCSLHDFVIWDQFWEGNPLISEGLLRQAVRRPKLNDGTKSDYGFGWVVERKGHWHSGAWRGANTFIARYPESGCCLVVLDNSSNPRVDKIAGHLVEALMPMLTKDE
jgi:CubicO group peptidase (beta-lactamase class C family)